MSELAAPGGIDKAGSPRAIARAIQSPADRPVGGIATWMRARVSLLGSSRRQRQALAVAQSAAALEHQLRALDDVALQARRRTIAASLRRHGLSTERAIEALALVREMCHRKLGMLPYLQQFSGGYALLRNAAIEMDTGEGKTL